MWGASLQMIESSQVWLELSQEVLSQVILSPMNVEQWEVYDE